ncbi:MAG TPA: VWA domain-containing protein [Bryobacteraceae bacterium]|nr:VWA domain-containing protein [Bryobacteraceae bacterium]
MVGRFPILLALAALAFGQSSEQKPAAEHPAANQAQPAATAGARTEVPQAPIQVQVNEVIVPVTVTDEKNRFVSNLDAKDFRIYDEGKEQKLHFFSREQKQPVVVGFLIDMSNANRLHWKTYQDAAIEMVLNLMPGDNPKYSGYLITYGNEAEVAVDTTSDPEKIVDKLRKLKPGGGAALYDAIYLACHKRHIIDGEPYDPRRVLIIIGDGHDTASKKSLDEVLELAQRNLVTIYGVGTTGFGFNSEGDKNLARLTEETGGRLQYPLQGLYSNVSGYLSTPSDDGNYAYQVGTGGYAAEISGGIFRAVANIAGEVTTQYVLRYTPDIDPRSDNKAFRNIRVTVDLPNVKIRARKGYYPQGMPAAAGSSN